MEILPYNKSLLLGFKYDGVDKDYIGSDITDITDYYNNIGEVYIGKIGDKVIGIGGVYPMWKGSGGCFLFLNKDAKKYKKSIYKALLIYLNDLIKKYGIKMMIVECLASSEEANRLINHLGFTKSRDIKMSMYLKRA